MQNNRWLLLFFLCLGLASASYSQDSLSKRPSPQTQLVNLVSDSVSTKRPYSRFFPSAFRVGTDLIAIGTSFADKNQKKFEVTADVDVDTYFASLDYGYANVTRSDTNFTYTNKGHYFRVGIDANLLPADEFRNIILVGLRYGHAFYSDALQYESKTNTPTGISKYTAENAALQSQWAEPVFGVKVQVVKQLYLGFTGRFKVNLANSGVGNLTPYEVPGYGNFRDGNAFGFNYYVYYRFPFRDKPIVIKPKKKKEPEEDE